MTVLLEWIEHSRGDAHLSHLSFPSWSSCVPLGLGGCPLLGGCLEMLLKEGLHLNMKDGTCQVSLLPSASYQSKRECEVMCQFQTQHLSSFLSHSHSSKHTACSSRTIVYTCLPPKNCSWDKDKRSLASCRLPMASPAQPDMVDWVGRRASHWCAGASSKLRACIHPSLVSDCKAIFKTSKSDV